MEGVCIYFLANIYSMIVQLYFGLNVMGFVLVNDDILRLYFEINVNKITTQSASYITFIFRLWFIS